MSHLLQIAHDAGIEGEDARTAVESFLTRMRALDTSDLMTLFGSDGARIAHALRTEVSA